MQELNRYIDSCIINEYATKKPWGYCLDVEQLPANELSNLFEAAMREDTNLRDTFLFYMQQLVDERLPIHENKQFVPQEEREPAYHYGDMR